MSYRSYRDIDSIAEKIEKCEYRDLVEMCNALHDMQADGTIWDLTQPHQWAGLIYSWAEAHMDVVRSKEAETDD